MDEHVPTLEERVIKMEAQGIETQNKLDQIIATILNQAQPTQKTPALIQWDILPEPPRMCTARPSAPPEFDGDHTKGTAFLNSCETYICLCPREFLDQQMKVVWAMSYMKSGRAQKWIARIFRWEQQPENATSSRFLDWQDFRSKFKKEFTPMHADALAVNRLESAAYYQKNWTLDDYIDEFQDLIADLDTLTRIPLWSSSGEV